MAVELLVAGKAVKSIAEVMALLVVSETNAAADKIVAGAKVEVNLYY